MRGLIALVLLCCFTHIVVILCVDNAIHIHMYHIHM